MPDDEIETGQEGNALPEISGAPDAVPKDVLPGAASQLPFVYYYTINRPKVNNYFAPSSPFKPALITRVRIATDILGQTSASFLMRGL